MAAIAIEVALGILGYQRADPWLLVGDDAGISGVLVALLAAYIAALALREVEVRRPDLFVKPVLPIVLKKDPMANPHGDVALLDLDLKLRISNEGQIAARDVIMRLAFRGFRGTPSGGLQWEGVASDPELHCPIATWRADTGTLVYRGFPKDIDLRFTGGTYSTMHEPHIDFEIVADASVRVKKDALQFDRDW